MNWYTCSLRGGAIRVAAVSILALGLTGTPAWAQTLSAPNTFQPNTPAKASEVNENFQFLLDLITKVELIDTTDLPMSSSIGKSADAGFGNQISVDRDITIRAFAFAIELTTDAGDLKFVIFDAVGTTLLWEGTPQSFPLDSGAATWKQSEDMCFVLEQGKTYKLGAIGNVNTSWPAEFTPNNKNGIDAPNVNINLSNFDSPQFSGNGGVNFWLKVFGRPDIALNCN